MSNSSAIMASAMQNAQINIRTISNNISNAATEGYTRQRVNMSSVPSVKIGVNAWQGSGATVDNIQRMQVQLLNDQVNVTKSTTLKSQTYLDNFSQLDMLMSNLENSMSSTIGEFTASASAMAADPSTSSTRDRFMSASSAVAARFQEMSVHVDLLNSSLNKQVEQAAADINMYAEQIANINISVNSGANELLDERDMLISKISEKTNVMTLRGSNGSVDVFLPNGQPLVIKGSTFKMETYRNQDDPTHLEVGFSGPNGPTPLAKGAVTSGVLAGIAAFRQDGLKQVQNEMGRMAIALADSANAAHKLGQTPEGTEGGNLFTYSQPTVHNYLSNPGTATLQAQITDSTKLTAATYKISYDGTAWSVTRSTDDKTTSYASLPINIDGVDLSIDSGSVAAGDQFLIDPARSGMASIKFALNTTSEIAAGYPISASDVPGNSGYGKVSSIEPTTAPWNASIKTSVDVATTGIGTFTVNGNAPDQITQTLGGWEIEYNGWKLKISGTPNTGDSYRIRSVIGSGDGRNASALAALSSARVINGESTVSAAYSRLVNSIGSKTTIAQTALQANEAIAEQAQTMRDNVSGVNLDEEATQLMRWQQMYQAAMKVTQTTDSLLDALFAAIG